MNLPWLEPCKKDLARRLDAGRLGHAPLIQGPAGTGKLALARWLVARILCLDPGDPEPCRQCRACELLDKGVHPDLFQVDIPEDKQVIPVDLIRELIERMQLTPSVSAHRVGLIVAADAMNANAANALLKTLEEPAPGAWIVLRSDQPARLPATVRSRCQKLVVRPPQQSVAANWLEQACPDSPASHRQAALALSGMAPLTARDMLAEGELERGLAMLDSLLDGSRGDNPADLADAWQQDAVASWQWLARWTALLMENRHRPAGVELSVKRPLPEDFDSAALARLWQQALEGGRLAMGGSVRQDLLLGKWLLEWQQMMQSRS